MTLFRLMLSTGIPELAREKDCATIRRSRRPYFCTTHMQPTHKRFTSHVCVPLFVFAVVWLQTTLTPGLTDEEATEHFEGLIMQALSERRDRVFRDLAHIWAHGK